MSNSKPILYALECGHAAPGAPTLVSGVLDCVWCQAKCGIAGVIEYEWHAKCRSCIFSRWAGLSKHNATIFASGHSSRNPAHIVIVEYARNPEAVKTTDKFMRYMGRKAI
jgi:hypothetical protein